MTINPRIALSLASIGAAATLGVGATFAFFSDSATSSGNVLAAGNLNLQIDDVDQSTTEAVSNSISFSNLAPGTSSPEAFISLHNGGSLDIAEVKLGSNQTGLVDNGGPENIGNVLNLKVQTGNDNTCDTGTVDHTAAIALAIGNNIAPLTLGELIATDYDALPGINTGVTEYVCFNVTLDSGAGNEYQGDSITVDFLFTGNQDASQ